MAFIPGFSTLNRFVNHGVNDESGITHRQQEIIAESAKVAMVATVALGLALFGSMEFAQTLPQLAVKTFSLVCLSDSFFLSWEIFEYTVSHGRGWDNALENTLVFRPIYRLVCPNRE